MATITIRRTKINDLSMGRDYSEYVRLDWYNGMDNFSAQFSDYRLEEAYYEDLIIAIKDYTKDLTNTLKPKKGLSVISSELIEVEV